MNTHYVLQVEWTEPGLPRLIGPFSAKSEAVEWAETNIPNGTWNVSPLAHPYLRMETR